VWKVGGKILAQGALADRSLFWWKSDTRPGTTEMEASWYPEAPPTDPADAAPALVSVLSRPVVTTNPQPISGELVPELSYSGLWHFRGTLTDRSSGTPLQTTAASDPAWILNNGSLLVRFAADSPAQSSSPDFLKDGLRPFTLNLSLKPSGEAETTVLWQTIDANNNPVLQLLLKDGARPALRAYATSGSFQDSDVTEPLPLDTTLLSVSVFPSGQDWALVWYIDGITVATGQLLGTKGLPEHPAGVRQVWSGSVWWDEAGFYTKTPEGTSSTDPEVFSRVLENRYGSDLVLAQGFDGLALPPGWTAPSLDVNLAVHLAPGQSVVSPTVTMPGGKHQWKSRVRAPSGTELSVQVTDTAGTVVWKALADANGVFPLWDRKNAEPVSVRIEWKNSGNADFSLDELSIIRKME
jgi:hypothetical protein